METDASFTCVRLDVVPACYASAVRVLLRLIAVLAAVSVVQTAVFIVGFGSVGLRALLATGTFGWLTLAG